MPLDHYFAYFKIFYVDEWMFTLTISRDECGVCFGKTGFIFWEKRSIFETYE